MKRNRQDNKISITEGETITSAFCLLPVFSPNEPNCEIRGQTVTTRISVHPRTLITLKGANEPNSKITKTTTTARPITTYGSKPANHEKKTNPISQSTLYFLQSTLCRKAALFSLLKSLSLV